MSDQDRLFRQNLNLPLEVIDQILDGDLGEARIGITAQLLDRLVQIGPRRDHDAISFRFKKRAKARPTIRRYPRAVYLHDRVRHLLRSFNYKVAPR